MEQKTSRPALDEVYLNMAKLIGTRSTCRHRDQGVVLVKGNHVISVGYNGAPPGQPHCIDLEYCAKGVSLPCRAGGLHAESNALMFAAKLGITVEGSKLYTVYSPCKTCCNLLRVAGVTEVIYKEEYTGYPGGPGYLEELGIWCRKIKTG